MVGVCSGPRDARSRVPGSLGSSDLVERQIRSTPPAGRDSQNEGGPLTPLLQGLWLALICHHPRRRGLCGLRGTDGGEAGCMASRAAWLRGCGAVVVGPFTRELSGFCRLRHVVNRGLEATTGAMILNEEWNQD